MVESYFQQGLEQAKGGNLAGAIDSFSCALRQLEELGELTNHPESTEIYPQVYYQRGLVLFQMQDQQGAIADYTQALTLNPQYFAAYTARSLAYIALKNFPAALTDAETAVNLDARSAPAQQLLGLIYKNQQKTQLAVNAYQRAASLFLEQEDEANCRRCIAAYRQLQTLLPPTPEDFFGKIKQKIQQGKSGEAMADLNWLLQADPHDAQALGLRGVIHSQGGDPIKALVDLNQALSLAPQDWEVRLHRGVIRRLMGDALGAIADFNQLLQENPRSVEAYMNRGFARCQLQDYRQGIEDFSRSISLKPDQPQYYGDRGEARYQFGDLAGAINDYQEAANLWFNRGDHESYQRGLDRLKTLQQELAAQKLEAAKQQSLPPVFPSSALPSIDLQQQLLGMVGGE
ncbi:MAG: tetratricopeptide repeat protein [Coleofasciculaceae cyanobacterium SM2_1_6]|nr:tetratricopeptide repeat protein [Coleofasciculaceae cyanobacterium SM2_1_6]